MDLASLKPAKGATKNRKRRGRGEGSGLGVTAGRGHKGYRSRGGSKKRAWFEGGQMPLQRRVPKFGFTNINKVVYQVVNVGDLEKLAGIDLINKDVLYEKRLVRKKRLPVKVLGDGEITQKINLEVNAISKSAREKIEKAGGSVTLV
ncbi:MAG TPA: 50S ribosomal protein L15 [Caldithrix abyssi]|uniref:Large ribosomal subunit protein uL15 n=1 Tax=Caldithrix abyssi TaxID=187145 RepID=A0A7V4TXU4_CALAY|nr:50S ribosomal protein L15 [Caldithrix abyssi]